MMNKHTPGPWEWQKHPWAGNWDLCDPNGNVVIDDGSVGDEYSPTINVHGPNARLIAAAPDMLDALYATLDFVEGRMSDGDPFQFVRDAIEKATGEKA